MGPPSMKPSDYPVRIHRTGERREKCAVYVVV